MTVLKLTAGLLATGGVGLVFMFFFWWSGDTPFWSSGRVLLLITGGVTLGCAVFVDERARRAGRRKSGQRDEVGR